MMNNIEILSPAGDEECLRAAILYGADAVYLAGKDFGMRSSADNFTHEQLAAAVSYAHNAGVRVYLTCNIVAHEKELEQLPQFLAYAQEVGIDALIISDLGVMRLAQKYAPDTQIHISTQTGVANSQTANMLHELGASRVVLARELSLDEISAIRAKTPATLELEAFVHGAMCVSFSGRCLLSNYMTGRDANRGDCAQPCRWSYSLVEEKRPGEYFPIFETERGTHILNSRDMCMIEHIPELVEAGITSLKIEGRAKAAYYAAVVTNAYRMALDHFVTSPDLPLPPEIAHEVLTVSHRKYSTGFYFGTEPGQNYENGGYERPYEVAAIVTGCDENTLTLSQRNKFCLGDELELVSPGMLPRTIHIESITDENHTPVDSAPHPMMTVTIPCSLQAVPGSILRRKK